ncbi:MAG: hypothetical protein KAS32_10125, partial [Candidatus Peribacteraceae bacterium]|nr:hypothetical protein [Candidatus Peribacteraceae bacterium]
RASRLGNSLVSDYTSLDEDHDDDEERGQVVPTPWAWLNGVLDGGPEKGDLGVILTNISVGKTTALVNMAKEAMGQGLLAVYFTFEDGEKKIKRRLIQCIANATIEDLRTNKMQMLARKNKFIMKYGGYCAVKDLQSRRSTVEDAANFIRAISEEHGRPVDIVLTDYADRFRAATKYAEPRHALREIFEDCKWLARELDVVHWTARQGKKELVGKERITMDGAGESWGSMESPDIVIGLGRTMEDEAMDRICLYTAKVRDSKDHESHSLETDYPRQRILEP